MPTVQGMTLACIRVNVIAIRCRALLCDGAIVSIYPANGVAVRPSPVDDLDRSCTPIVFVQDGAGSFYGCVLADRLSSVDPHATFVLTRGTGKMM